ncbi:MFS transporter [Modestobacter lapidis]|nr:MFS transporter [Modestobacter lapidis]
MRPPRGPSGTAVDRADTAPLEVRRPQTRPLPVAAAQPPGDDDPTVAGVPFPPAAPPGPAPVPPAPEPLPGAAGPASAGGRKVTVTRVAAARSRELTGAAVRRVRAASRADGAGDTGLAGLVGVNALHMAGDAMIAVSLAGTLFFAAPADAQRGNVALYLLVTMAPFVLLAPVIGPLLDRLQHGRRWAMAASLGGRAVLAVLMASSFDDVALYPAALGVLVLSKGFNVLRAAVVPRVLPPAMSLTSANARMSVFGLAAGGVLGGLGAGLAWLLGFSWELGATAAVFTVAAVLAVRLPPRVDVSVGEEPANVLTTAEIPMIGRRRPAGPHVATALRATAALRGLGGFLTIFSAFLVQATVSGGWPATLALGAIAAAAGLGSFGGTAVASRLHTTSPDRLVLVSAGGAAAVTVLAAVFYSFPMAAVVAGVSAVANALGKAALDAIVQREVSEAQRASAFARSETVLQLAWVAGGVLAISLPATGWLGFTVAAALLVLAVALTLLGRRRAGATTSRAGRRRTGDIPAAPGGGWA